MDKSTNDMNQSALNEIVRVVRYIANNFFENNSTKIYDGVVLSQADNGKWNIRYNNKTHAVKQYGSGSISKGQMVKVFIPQGNQNLSFFM